MPLCDLAVSKREPNGADVAITTQKITVTSAPTLIAHPDSDDHDGKTVMIQCTANFYIGGPDVTPAGYPAPANTDVEIADYRGDVYICVDPANNGAIATLLWIGV